MSDLEPVPQPPPTAPVPRNPWPVTFLLVFAMTLTAGLLTLYTAPEWTLRWRQGNADAEAEAGYLKRQAELKAESEAADKRLAAIDQRVNLISLGFREVSRKVAPYVIHIGNEIEVKDPRKDRRGGKMMFDAETRRSYLEQAEGSGILVKPGLVLTNYHVVRNAQRLRITFASGQWTVADPSRVSFDQLTDLAVIRLPENAASTPKDDFGLTAEFADSDKDVQVGDWVLAAGSPFGLRQSMSAGIISAKGRAGFRGLEQVELLQTDAAVNPGNSGGPLFDQLGRVAGINVAIATSNGNIANAGVAFAIPSNTAREVFTDLVEKGEVVRGFLGIGLQELQDEAVARWGLKETGGVLVSMVEPDSPADVAGLIPGDTIISFEGEPVGNRNALNRLRQSIGRTPPDATVSIEVFRRNERLTLKATLVKRLPAHNR